MVAFFMIGLALIFDGFKALLDLITFGLIGWAINPFINFWATLTFWFWFTYLGVSFMKSGKMLGAKIASLGLPSLIGLLPFIGDLPLWTSGVIMNISIVYAEDMLEAFSPKTIQTLSKGLSKFKRKQWKKF